MSDGRIDFYRLAGDALLARGRKRLERLHVIGRRGFRPGRDGALAERRLRIGHDEIGVDLSAAGKHAPLLKNLPRDVGALTRVVQGLLIHEHMAEAYGVDAVTAAGVARWWEQAAARYLPSP